MSTYATIIGQKCLLCDDGVIPTQYKDENGKVYDVHNDKVFCDSCLAKLRKIIKTTELE